MLSLKAKLFYAKSANNTKLATKNRTKTQKYSLLKTKTVKLKNFFLFNSLFRTLRINRYGYQPERKTINYHTMGGRIA